MAYEQIEGPLGSPQRIEYMLASLMALTANINRDAKRRPRAFTAADFMPKWGAAPSVPERTPDDLKRLAMDATRAFGGTVRKLGEVRSWRRDQVTG